LLAWNFFAAAVNNSANSVVASESLITKVYFPRLIIPISATLTALADLGMALLAFLVLMLIYGELPGPSLLAVPMVIGTLYLGALGLGTMLAGWNVTYRDVRHLVGFGLQVGFFATPSIFLPGGAPQVAATATATSAATTQAVGWGLMVGGQRFALSHLNPMYGIVVSLRAALLGQPMPWGDLAYSATLALIAIMVGVWCFRRFEDGFADNI
jgi:lipopolysaccharide transport system permease protein